MTARLREKCAELRVRAANLMASPSNRIRLATGKAYIDCAEEFEAILDAEGDGGAVAWMTRHDEPMLFLSREEAGTYCDDDEDPISLYTHPTRSGVVSDADVEAACAIYFGGRHWPHGVEEVELVRISMRAALEHFAKGEHHER